MHLFKLFKSFLYFFTEMVGFSPNHQRFEDNLHTSRFGQLEAWVSSIASIRFQRLKKMDFKAMLKMHEGSVYEALARLGHI